MQEILLHGIINEAIDPDTFPRSRHLLLPGDVSPLSHDEFCQFICDIAFAVDAADASSIVRVQVRNKDVYLYALNDARALCAARGALLVSLLRWYSAFSMSSERFCTALESAKQAHAGPGEFDAESIALKLTLLPVDKQHNQSAAAFAFLATVLLAKHKQRLPVHAYELFDICS